MVPKESHKPINLLKDLYFSKEFVLLHQTVEQKVDYFKALKRNGEQDLAASASKVKFAKFEAESYGKFLLSSFKSAEEMFLGKVLHHINCWREMIRIGDQTCIFDKKIEDLKAKFELANSTLTQYCSERKKLDNLRTKLENDLKQYLEDELTLLSNMETLIPFDKNENWKF
jgi:hypothetical protein